MQNPVLAGIILGVIGLIMGIATGRPVTFGLLGFLLGHGLVMGNKLIVVQREVERLSSLLAKIGSAGQSNITADINASTDPEDAVTKSAADDSPAVATHSRERSDSMTTEPPDEPVNPPPASPPVDPWTTSATPSKPATSPRPAAARVPRPPSPVISMLSAGFTWFTSGNLFMKVGIGLLFLGVGFLLNYVAGQGFFTLEMRLIAIAVAGIAALVAGQRLLAARRDYALMLQGAAIGVLYLDIFGAFSLYELLPATLAFGLLAFISALSAILAVLQKAPALAFAGFAGGFLAPVLASSGSGNYVALFSYYVVLNAALVGVAWFKSWRSLNLLGFYFTFGIAAVWGVDSYSADKYASTQPFLIIFFLLFVAISILYARRQPPQLKGYVDASLLFATPVIAFSMQLVLMDPYEYGSAWSAFGFGAFYISLTAMLWRVKNVGEQLLMEVFLVLGVLFTTLVIPFALGASDTAGAWALEGAGMIWIGLRQNRVLARVLGIVLQVAAAFFWLTHQPANEPQMFVNSGYLAGVMIALAGFFSARLYRAASSKWEAPLGVLWIVWFVAWWYGIGYREIGLFVEAETIPNWIVGYTALSALLVFELARRLSWSNMRMTSLAAPVPYLLAALYLAFFVGDVPHEHLGWLIWTPSLLAYGWMLWRSENELAGFEKGLVGLSHVFWAVMLLAYFQWESIWYAVEVLSLDDSWLVAWIALPLIGVLQLIHRAAFWPIVNWAKAYAGVVNTAVAFVLSIYVLFSLGLSGDADPLPWIPLLNPLDLVTLLAVFTVYTACLDMSRLFPVLNQQQVIRLSLLALGLAIFTWLNVTLFRSLHQWKGFAYDLDRMLDYSYTQSSLSILWVTIGMILVVVAARISSRTLWISGAVLLGAVVLKLFVQDLANTGSLARIVSFLGVGGVLVVIGYFSPLPPAKTSAASGVAT
jgi:uncharacterized membrane protein